MREISTKAYPLKEEIDEWINSIWKSVQQAETEVIKVPDSIYALPIGQYHLPGSSFYQFRTKGRKPFYVFWQPTQRVRGPLLVHLPGGGAEFSTHPDLTAAGWNVIDINPLGIMTPSGLDQDVKYINNVPPPLLETYMVSEQSGYRDWLIDSVIATQWARSQEGVEPDRFAFFGTSQGGMGAALLASAYYQKGAAALMAEQPFAADFKVSMALDDPVNYLNNRVYTDITDMDNPSEGFRRIGFIDLTSHVHRIDVPTLLALGDKDVLCPAESIRSFYDKLSTTKALLEIKGQEHGFTNIFVQQALAWAKCHV